MNDGVHILGKCRNGGFVDQVAGDDFLMFTLTGRHRADIRDSNDGGVSLQGFSEYLAQATGGAGEQNAVEGFVRRERCCHGQVVL